MSYTIVAAINRSARRKQDIVYRKKCKAYGCDKDAKYEAAYMEHLGLPYDIHVCESHKQSHVTYRLV